MHAHNINYKYEPRDERTTDTHTRTCIQVDIQIHREIWPILPRSQLPAMASDHRTPLERRESRVENGGRDPVIHQL